MNESVDSLLYSFVLMVSFSCCVNVCVFFFFVALLVLFFHLFLFFIGFLVSLSLSLQSIFLRFPDEHRSLIALGRLTVQNRDSLVKWQTWYLLTVIYHSPRSRKITFQTLMEGLLPLAWWYLYLTMVNTKAIKVSPFYHMIQLAWLVTFLLDVSLRQAFLI